MSELSLPAAELELLSRLFAYPDELPSASDLARIGAEWGTARGQEALSSLQAEYVRLFINALPEVPCPPYGSFYLEGALMGESTVRLRSLYARYGLQTDEMADHIAVELEFLAFLSALGQDGLVREDYDFLLSHLNRWAPAFWERVAEHDRSGLYRAAARYAQNVLAARGDFPAGRS